MIGKTRETHLAHYCINWERKQVVLCYGAKRSAESNLLLLDKPSFICLSADDSV